MTLYLISGLERFLTLAARHRPDTGFLAPADFPRSPDSFTARASVRLRRTTNPDALAFPRVSLVSDDVLSAAICRAPRNPAESIFLSGPLMTCVL
jgi:hypothetical protein